VGSTEVLLSDSERLVDRINQEGGDAHLNVWPDMPHVFQLFTIPESETAIAKLSAFLKSHMPVAAA
jgi:acetyl esterase/lipase